MAVIRMTFTQLNCQCFTLLLNRWYVLTWKMGYLYGSPGPIKQEAQLLLGDRATRKHAKDC